VISLSLFDLDLLDDLIGDNLAGIAMMFGAQALLLAIMIAVALRNRFVALAGRAGGPQAVWGRVSMYLAPGHAPLKFHPLANLFPMLSDKELDELADRHPRQRPGRDRQAAQGHGAGRPQPLHGLRPARAWRAHGSLYRHRPRSLILGDLEKPQAAASDRKPARDGGSAACNAEARRQPA
jgi:hypothetical protein